MISCGQFFRFRPHLPFRFVVNFFTDKSVDSNKLGYYVSSIKVNAPEVDTTTGAFYFGNGYRTVPIVDPSAKTIDITFEETDDMQVTKFFDEIIAQQRFGLPYVVQIGVTEFDERMNSPVRAMLYSCILSNYEEGAFSRMGGVSIVTISATFAVMSEKPWESSTKIVAGKQVQDAGIPDNVFSTLQHEAETSAPSPAIQVLESWNAEFNSDLATRTAEREADKAAKREAQGGGGGGSAPGHEHAKVTGGQFQQRDREAAKRNTFVKNNANPVKLTPAQTEQLKRIYNKTRGTLERGGKGDSFETWKRRFEQEHDATKANVVQILNNTEKTVDNTLKLQQKMKEQGYDIRLAGCADTYGALLGQHAESSEHNNGNKADIQIWKDGKAIDFKKATNDEVIAAQKAVADTNLVKTGVIEFNSDGGGAGWMDVNFTGNDWINSNGVRTDGVMNDTAHKGMTKASK